MKDLISYLIQMIAASGILYGYYHFVLRNKKFHHYNRFYLLSAFLISIVIPFINIPVYFASQETDSSFVLQTLRIFSSDSDQAIIVQYRSRHEIANWFTWQNLSYLLYILIACLAILKIILSIRKIRIIIRNHPAEKLNKINFVNTNEPGTPFSFFRWLFWNRKIELKSEKGQQIFRHEVFHIEQKHSYDLVFIEILTAIFWINPFFHLIKKELKAIHEFLADEFAVKENERWEYAELLLMQVLNTKNSLINPFFHNQIKRRIAMITSSSKSGYQYLRKLLVLPVAAIIVVLFAFSYKERKKEPNSIDIVQDTVKPSNRILVKENIPVPKPFSKTIPTTELLDSWQDSKIYGIWVDNKRIANTELKRYSPNDFSHYFVSKLSKNAINYGKHYYQVDLMTNKFYENYVKNWDPNKTFTVTHLMDRDTIPKVINSAGNALIVIDGKQQPDLTINQIDKKVSVNDIEPIHVLKGDTASKKYGITGKNGVIEIFTKQNKNININEVTLIDTARENNKIFEKVEIEPSFPGGEAAWKRYLQKNLSGFNPADSGATEGSYTVIVQFIVHEDGFISDVKALTNFGHGMEGKAIELIRKGPKWEPAVQNGHKVTAYKKQKVTFVIQEEK